MPTASGILCAAHTPQDEPDTVNVTDFSAEPFGKIDDAITDAPRHSQAICSTSEVVTIDVRYGVKEVSKHDCYPWFRDNYCHLFLQLPGMHAPRCFRRLHTQQYRTIPSRARPDRHCRPLRH